MSSVTDASLAALCVTRNAALRRTIRRTVHAAGLSIEFIDELSDSTGARAAIIIVDRDSFGGTDDELMQAAGPGGKIIIVGDSLDDDQVIERLRHQPMDHLITDLCDGDEHVLLVTSAKLVSGDIFGLRKYLSWGVPVHESRIQSYTQKRAAVSCVAAYAKAAGARRQLISRIEIVVDELLMNALYDAPSIRHGGTRQERVTKSVEGNVSTSEAAILCYAADGRYLAVSVQDNFGELKKSAILDHLMRARAQKGRPKHVGNGTGGAGLGLYFILSAATRFIANIDAGQRTEVICLFDLRQTGRDATTCAQSLHIFHSRSLS